MRIIRGVAYRHVAAYVTVVGRGKIGARRNLEQVRGALLASLPPRTEVKPGRYKGLEDGLYCYEIPIVLLDGPQPVRATLAKMALKGRP